MDFVELEFISFLLVAWLAWPIKRIRPNLHVPWLNVLWLDSCFLSDLLGKLLPLLRVEVRTRNKYNEALFEY